MQRPFQIVQDFESALCEYAGAPYAVTTTSCTMALLLAVAWHLRDKITKASLEADPGMVYMNARPAVDIPKRTYVGVPMSIIHAGGRPTFRDDDWTGCYQLKPLLVWDCARRFDREMYRGGMVCVSFHPSKILGLSTHGGAILHNDPEAHGWLCRARFDGRAAGVHPSLDVFHQLGWHCYMNPVTAAEGLEKLSRLKPHNPDLPWGPGTDSDYPDLSTMEVFK